MPSLRSDSTSAARRRYALRLAALLAGVAVVTCRPDVTAPFGTARLELAPQFAPGASPTGTTLGVDQVRVEVLRHSTQETALDKTYPFATGTSLQLALSFPLKQATDTFDLTIQYRHGTEVLFAGTQVAVAGAGAPASPIGVTVAYVGPGVHATSLALAPRDTILTSGDSLQFRLTVLDTATLDSVYTGWGTSNVAQPVDPAGHLVAKLIRGTITVRAVTPSPPGLSDSTTVRIVPKPVAMVKFSGDGQSGASGTALAQPLVAQVNGSDNLGVPGVTVTFAAQSGGGSVDSTTVVTDSLGRAGTTVKLGPAIGSGTFTGTAGALSVTFSANATTAPPKTWTGAVSTDWNTAGNWSPAGVPAATDSVVVPNVSNPPQIHQGAFSVHGLSVQSGAIVTLDTAVLTDFGGYANLGGLNDPQASSSLVLSGTGSTLSGNLNVTTTVVQGTYTLTGRAQGLNVEVVGSVTMAGHALVATASFTTAGTGVIVMTTAADSLMVQGTAAFAGGVETGHLTAGTFFLGGNFAVTVPSGFDAGFSHLTVFNGSQTQTVVVFDTTKSNQFGSVEFRNSTGGVLFSQLTGINGNARLDTSAVVTSSDTTYTGGGMAMNGGLTTFLGSLLKVGELWVNTTFNAGGTYAVTSTIFTGNGQTIPVGVSFPFLYVAGNVSMGTGVTVGTQVAVQGGTVTLSGNFSFPGNTFTQFGGSLILNGHTYSTGGTFTANNNGVLKMTNALDTLKIGGNAFFQGASESGLLTAGGIVFGGNFTEGGGDPQAFASTGTSADFTNGGSAQTITFGHPGGVGSSHFYDLGVGNPQGALGIGSDVYILGHGAFLAGAPKIVSGGGQVVHFANLSIDSVTFNNVAIAYDAALGGANLIALDSITFENYDTNSATPLISITSPGNTASPGTSFSFYLVNFLNIIGTGSGIYLKAVDSNTGDGNVLAIDITTNLAVTEGQAHYIATNATVNWFPSP